MLEPLFSLLKDTYTPTISTDFTLHPQTMMHTTPNWSTEFRNNNTATKQKYKQTKPSNTSTLSNLKDKPKFQASKAISYAILLTVKNHNYQVRELTNVVYSDLSSQI